MFKFTAQLPSIEQVSLASKMSLPATCESESVTFICVVHKTSNTPTAYCQKMRNQIHSSYITAQYITSLLRGVIELDNHAIQKEKEEERPGQGEESYGLARCADGGVEDRRRQR